MPLRFSLLFLALLPFPAEASDSFVIGGQQSTMGIPQQPAAIESYGGDAASPDPSYGDNSGRAAVAQSPAQPQQRVAQRPTAHVPPGWDSLTDGTAGGGGVLNADGTNTRLPIFNRYQQQRNNYGMPYDDGYAYDGGMSNQQQREMMGGLLNSMTQYIGAISGGSTNNSYNIPNVGSVDYISPAQGNPMPAGWEQH